MRKSQCKKRGRRLRIGMMHAGIALTVCFSPIELATGYAEGIQVGGIKTGSIQTGGIKTGSIQTGSIQTGSIQTGSIQTGSIQTGSIQTGSIQTGSIQTGNIQTGSIQTGNIQTGGIQTGDIRNGGIQTGGIQTGGIQTGGIQTGNVHTGGIQAGGIQTGSIKNGTISSGNGGSGNNSNPSNSSGSGNGTSNQTPSKPSPTNPSTPSNPSTNNKPGGNSNTPPKKEDTPVSVPKNRSKENYLEVLNKDKFDVTKNYLPDKYTYCNIFTRNVMKEMGANIPQMLANDMYDWLQGAQAKKQGWREVSAEEAQRLANAGMPTVASWQNTSGPHGHIAPVVPYQKGETFNSKDIASSVVVKNAGGKNYNYTTLNYAFGRKKVPQIKFFVYEN